MFIFVSDVAFIQYDKFDNILDYNETQVPPAFQSKGIAQILAKVNGDFSSAIFTVEFI
jgi:predicted GNAT family acetyltransferase